jgi:HD-like signal output (HDOD) protein
LLHEVGKLYILMRAKDDLETLTSDGAFQSVLAAWHPRLGKAVIEAWALPAQLATAVGDHETCSLTAPEPLTMTAVVAVANYLAEHSEAACEDADFHSKAPSFGSLSLDKATFDWLIRAAAIDVRLMTIAFGV